MEEGFPGNSRQGTLHSDAALGDLTVIHFGEQLVEIFSLPAIVAAPEQLDIAVIVGGRPPRCQPDRLCNLLLTVDD